MTSSRGCYRCLRRAGWRCRGAGAIRTRPYCHHTGGYRRSEAVAAARCRSVAADPRRARERSGRASSRRTGPPVGGSVTEGLSRSSVGGRRASSLRLRSWKPEARVRVRGGDWRSSSEAGSPVPFHHYFPHEPADRCRTNAINTRSSSGGSSEAGSRSVAAGAATTAGRTRTASVLR